MGAALLHPVDGFQVNPKDDKFAKVWRSVDASFVQRLSSALVVNLNGISEAGEVEPTTVEYFQTSLPETGSSYMYDATMAVGLGACIAEQQARITSAETISSHRHILGIRAANFTGASGHVEFGVTLGLLGNITASRHSSFMTVGIFNLFPPKNNLDDSEE